MREKETEREEERGQCGLVHFHLVVDLSLMLAVPQQPPLPEFFLSPSPLLSLLLHRSLGEPGKIKCAFEKAATSCSYVCFPPTPPSHPPTPPF